MASLYYFIRHVTFKLPFVDVIHPQSNKFVMGVKVKATCDEILNDLPLPDLWHSMCFQKEGQIPICFLYLSLRGQPKRKGC